MLRLKLISIVLCSLVVTLKSQRRITEGQATKTGKNYAVYLIKAIESKSDYDTWLCGGAIVSEWYIITSAACVEDVLHLYAVAEVKNYVQTSKLDSNKCANNFKKKIVFTCVPESYNLDEKVEVWSLIDLAVVKVESRYQFDLKAPRDGCTHLPQAIPINFESKYQEPGIEVIAMGWGHLKEWRSPGDEKDYNQAEMNFASALIHDKSECKKYFTDYPTLGNVIDKYMICTMEGGNLDDKGYLIRSSKPIADGCTPKLISRMGYTCQQDETVLIDGRKSNVDPRKVYSRILHRQQTRRQGICQNDHGGPLVAFVGESETLVGVASVFRVTNESTCTGPYLYTSTECNGAFIACTLNLNITRRNYNCDKLPSETGYKAIRRSISWEKHPDGPAANERIMIRATPPFDKEHPWGRR